MLFRSLLAIGHLSEPAMQQFEATLYGSTTVCDFTDNGKCMDCFFSITVIFIDFYRFKDDLDAAIISTESDAKLLLNPFSPRYEEMKSCSLSVHLGKAVVDPVKKAKDNEAYIVEGDIDRDRKSTRLNSSHIPLSRMPSSA